MCGGWALEQDQPAEGQVWPPRVLPASRGHFSVVKVWQAVVPLAVGPQVRAPRRGRPSSISSSLSASAAPPVAGLPLRASIHQSLVLGPCERGRAGGHQVAGRQPSGRECSQPLTGNLVVTSQLWEFVVYFVRNMELVKCTFAAVTETTGLG